ncbi:MAG TPA: response regulator [Steroidobacteraceae bacterium]|nr:response regulator [Steroidobacteraceae bacterium]
MTRELPLVLAVEDEPQMQSLIRMTLQTNGMRCAEAHDAREAWARIDTQRPDIIVADLGLPDGDGIDLIRRVRAVSQVPILVLSARSQERDKIAALDAGADDYVTKPFSAGELVARLRVGLRHAAARRSAEPPSTFAVRELHIDLLRRKVSLREKPIHLTPIEYRLLAALVHKAGQVVTHAELLAAGWGASKVDQQHYLRIYMTALRRKLERDSARPEYLLTETGVGYRLIDE